MKFIVISTGSSGSTSLAALIKGCGVRCRHERNFKKPLLWAYTKKEAIKRINRFKKEGDYCEVAIAHLQYLPAFLAEIPNIKILCLKRDREKTVNTIVKESIYSNPFSLNINHLFEIAPNEWGLGYPKFTREDEKSIKECAEIFYDSYYHRVEEIEKIAGGRVKTFLTEDINSIDGQNKIFDFLEIPKERRVYKEYRLNVHDPNKYMDY